MDKNLSIAISNPKSLIEFSNELKKFIVKQGLFTNIQGKNYVNVEGWQFAGGNMGLFPVVEYCDRLDREEKEIAYKASVVLYAGEKIVSRGVAICSDREKGKKSKDEYVIASMAQTRAEGKAYRLVIGWLMKVAGYEATPAEDMEWAQKEEKKKGIEVDESVEIPPVCSKCGLKGIKLETKNGINFYTCPEADLHRKHGEKFKMEQPKKLTPEEQKIADELDSIK